MQEKRVTERKDAKMAELGNAHMHDSIASKLRAEKKKNLNLTYLREKHREPVKGVFRYYEVPQGVLRFVFHEFEGDPIQKYTLYDGQVYTLPLGVANISTKTAGIPYMSMREMRTTKYQCVLDRGCTVAGSKAWNSMILMTFLPKRQNQ